MRGGYKWLVRHQDCKYIFFNVLSTSLIFLICSFLNITSLQSPGWSATSDLLSQSAKVPTETAGSPRTTRPTFKKISISILCVWVFWLYACLFATCVRGALGGQSMASDLLELKLQVVVSHDVSTGNWAQSLQKSIAHSQLLNIDSASIDPTLRMSSEELRIYI